MLKARIGDDSLPSIPVLSDRFRENPGNFLGNGSPKTPGISRVLVRRMIFS